MKSQPVTLQFSKKLIKGGQMNVQKTVFDNQTKSVTFVVDSLEFGVHRGKAWLTNHVDEGIVSGYLRTDGNDKD
jgi:hypothetical protein